MPKIFPSLNSSVWRTPDLFQVFRLLIQAQHQPSLGSERREAVWRRPDALRLPARWRRLGSDGSCSLWGHLSCSVESDKAKTSWLKEEGARVHVHGGIWAGCWIPVLLRACIPQRINWLRLAAASRSSRCLFLICARVIVLFSQTSLGNR